MMNTNNYTYTVL